MATSLTSKIFVEESQYLKPDHKQPLLKRRPTISRRDPPVKSPVNKRLTITEPEILEFEAEG